MESKIEKQIGVAIAWNELPAYAANAIRVGIQLSGIKVDVLATKPTVPFKNIEAVLTQEVYWIDRNKPIKWKEYGLLPPDVFFVSGWSGDFEELIVEVKKSGGKVIAMSDRMWNFDIKNIRKWAKFQLVYRRRIDAIWVPGFQGVKNARIYGLRRRDIYTGVLTAITSNFVAGCSLDQRGKKFIFIGRYEPVKNITNLVTAFIEFSKEKPDWVLETYGCGSLADKLRNVPGVISGKFLQPENLAEKLKAARFLILPSIKEPWGLVIHEACCCGCGLLVSNNIGAAKDLGSVRNMVSFEASSIHQIVNAMLRVANMSDDKLINIEKASLEKSKLRSPDLWAKVFIDIINRFA